MHLTSRPLPLLVVTVAVVPLEYPLPGGHGEEEVHQVEDADEDAQGAHGEAGPDVPAELGLAGEEKEKSLNSRKNKLTH